MEDGRLVRLARYRGDANAVAYIVAISNPSGAVDLIRERPPILRTGFRIWAA
jgi:hypothetical protein